MGSLTEKIRNAIEDHDSLVADFGNCILPEHYQELADKIVDVVVEHKFKVSVEIDLEKVSTIVHRANQRDSY